MPHYTTWIVIYRKERMGSCQLVKYASVLNAEHMVSLFRRHVSFFPQPSHVHARSSFYIRGPLVIDLTFQTRHYSRSSICIMHLVYEDMPAASVHLGALRVVRIHVLCV